MLNEKKKKTSQKSRDVLQVVQAKSSALTHEDIRWSPKALDQQTSFLNNYEKKMSLLSFKYLSFPGKHICDSFNSESECICPSSSDNQIISIIFVIPHKNRKRDTS